MNFAHMGGLPRARRMVFALLGGLLCHIVGLPCAYAHDGPAIAAGFQRGLAVGLDGRAYAWGGNDQSAIGDGTSICRYSPVEIRLPAGGKFKSVAAGYKGSLALDDAGKLYFWGENTDGGLAGGGSSVASPTALSMPDGVAAVQATMNGRNSYFVGSDGRVYGWGLNANGELGNGTKAPASMPTGVQLAPGVAALAVSAGGEGSYAQPGEVNVVLALGSDGKIYGWGRNGAGNIGDGTTVDRVLPVKVSLPNAVKAVAVEAASRKSYAIGADGRLYVWGDDFLMSCGASCRAPQPMAAAGALTFSALARVTGGSQGSIMAAIGTDGKIYTWAEDGIYGFCNAFLLGRDLVNNRCPQGLAALAMPVKAKAVALNLGLGLGVALGEDNRVYTWGQNSEYGELGVNSGSVSVSTQVPKPILPLDIPQASATPQTGWWWNPGESGRGFSIEVTGSTLFMAAYLYDPSGRAAWYISSGALNPDGSYSGVLQEYSGGQTMAGKYQRPRLAGNVSPVSLICQTATACSLAWAGGVVAIRRYVWDDKPVAAGTPETGWWWNADESGRGYFLEQQGGTLFLSGYMYDATGNDVWYISTGSRNGTVFLSNWMQCANGQSMSGTYKAPQCASLSSSALTIQFSDTTKGLLTLPDGRQIPISRYRF